MLKLQNQANFGPSGTIKYQIVTKSISPPISVATLEAHACDIFHIGADNHDSGGGSYGALSSSDVSQLREWAGKSLSHVVLGFQSYLIGFGSYGGATSGAVNPMTATELGDSFIERGPFGNAAQFSQGGSWKGTLSTLDESACVLVHDALNKPVFVIDMEYSSIFIADSGIVTTLGGTSSGGGISTVNDQLFGNLYAFLMGIVCLGPPADCHFDTDPFTKCNPPPATTTIR